MLTIEGLQMSSPDIPVTDNVHPFYKDSIRYLFGVDQLVETHSSPTRNRMNITNSMRKTLGDCKYDFLFFLDIRFQEELGSPSPQYEILSDLKLASVTPICVHGDNIDIIKEGVKIIDTLLNKDEKALCAISNMASAAWQYSGLEFVISFILSSDGQSDGLINVKGNLKYETK